jgi:hypothetical protein
MFQNCEVIECLVENLTNMNKPRYWPLALPAALNVMLPKTSK